MNRITIIMMVVGLVLATGISAQAQYDDGDGSAEFPYEIAESNQLIYMSQHPEHWDQHFILTADLNMNLADPNTFTTALIAPDTDNDDIYNQFQGTPFTGNFNGNHHIISNLTIDTDGVDNYYLGLFGQIEDPNAGVKDLGLENVIITGGNMSGYLAVLCGYSSGNISYCYSTGSVSGGDFSPYLGGLCGRNEVRGSISNCYSTVSITGGEFSTRLGGLCGRSSGNISYCYSSGSIAGDNYLGGLCGYNFGSISHCNSSGSVAGDYLLGGLCGGNEEGSISHCYSTGTVTGDHFLGGLCGWSYEGGISNCYSTGSVSGRYDLGGLCGRNHDIIKNCFASGTVTGGDNSFNLGGLCGYIVHGSISNCYSTGSVTGGIGSSDLGGLCGKNDGSIGNCYFLDSAGPDNGFGEPLDDPNMRIQSRFVGWDFVSEETNGTENIWRMCVDGIEYPKLYWQFHYADFTCPDGVEMLDLWDFCNQWLTEGDNLRCDIAPVNIPDGIVNLFDYIEVSRYWLNEISP